MTPKPHPISISLEGEIYSEEANGPLRLRLSMTLDPEGNGPVPDAEVTQAAEALRTTMLGTLKGLNPEAAELRPNLAYEGPTRSLEVLREVYTPRSPAHVDALLWEGEISKEEHDTLLVTLRSRSPAASAPPPSPARTVEELVRELKLHEMRDANRARFQRAITYDEWVSLKQHFSRPEHRATA